MSVSHDQTLRLWNAADGELIAVLRGHAGFIWAVAYGADGKLAQATIDDLGIAGFWGLLIDPEYGGQGAPFTRRTETILWNKWAMALLIGLLTLEWVLRKLNSLS